MTEVEPPTLYPPSQVPPENLVEGGNAPEPPWERLPPSIEVVLWVCITAGMIAWFWAFWELFRWLVRLALK